MFSDDEIALAFELDRNPRALKVVGLDQLITGRRGYGFSVKHDRYEKTLRQKHSRELSRSSGLCIFCVSKQAPTSKWMCAFHLERTRLRLIAWRKKNSIEYNQRRRLKRKSRSKPSASPKAGPHE